MKKYLFILFFIHINTAFAENIENYINRAIDLKLYNYKEWSVLLHYKNKKSIINNKEFFISNNGRYSKKDELVETIKGFYSVDITESDTYQHPICKYPARFDFLNKYLNFENLPKVNCIKYQAFFNEIKPESLTMIFPTTYINNPASMFGHTLIRIDKEDSFKNNSYINSIIINYGADTKGETSGIIYAFKGVFGIYDGIFSATYYYNMINNYNNLENRDIIEYKLNYTKEQSILYTKHIWELLNAKISYYFFQKNCSYLMLETLNILNVDYDLTKNFILETTPINTIKLLKQRNIITEKKYRPSIQKEIQDNINTISKQDIKKIKNFMKKDVNELELNDNLSYQLTYKYLEYNKVKRKFTEEEYKKKSFYILKKINSTENNQKLKIEDIEYPDEGHNTNRVGLLVGRKKDKNYIQLAYKPTYQELVDDNYGFEKNSEIGFLNINVNYFLKDKKFDLETLDFIKIKSLPKQSNIFKPISFTILFGINNLYNENKILLLESNGGITFGNDIFSTSFLIGPKFNTSKIFDNYYNIGGNGVFIFRINLKYMKTIFEYQSNKFYYIKYNYDKLSLENNFILNKNLLLNLKFERFFYRTYKNYNNFNIGLKYFF